MSKTEISRRLILTQANNEELDTDCSLEIVRQEDRVFISLMVDALWAELAIERSAFFDALKAILE